MNEKENLPVLITAWREGSIEARDRLISTLYPELRQIAAQNLRKHGQNASVFTTDLLHSALEKLLKYDGANIADRGHLLALASLACRQVLLDLSKRKSRSKRNGIHITFDDEKQALDNQELDLESLDDALVRLEKVNPQYAELVIMRFFGGLSTEEIAESMGLSTATIGRKWKAAQQWLLEALDQ